MKNTDIDSLQTPHSLAAKIGWNFPLFKMSVPWKPLCLGRMSDSNETQGYMSMNGNGKDYVEWYAFKCIKVMSGCLVVSYID